MPFLNPYEVLGLSADATEKEIKKAYHRASLLTHPDRIQGDDAAKEEGHKKFLEVNTAYELLKSGRYVPSQKDAQQSSPPKSPTQSHQASSQSAAKEGATASQQGAPHAHNKPQPNEKEVADALRRLRNVALTRAEKATYCEMIAAAMAQNPQMAARVAPEIALILSVNMTSSEVPNLFMQILRQHPDAITAPVVRQIAVGGLNAEWRPPAVRRQYCEILSRVFDQKPEMAAAVSSDLVNVVTARMEEPAVVSLFFKGFEANPSMMGEKPFSKIVSDALAGRGKSLGCQPQYVDFIGRVLDKRPDLAADAMISVLPALPVGSVSNAAVAVFHKILDVAPEAVTADRVQMLLKNSFLNSAKTRQERAVYTALLSDILDKKPELAGSVLTGIAGGMRAIEVDAPTSQLVLKAFNKNPESMTTSVLRQIISNGMNGGLQKGSNDRRECCHLIAHILAKKPELAPAIVSDLAQAQRMFGSESSVTDLRKHVESMAARPAPAVEVPSDDKKRNHGMGYV